MTQVLAFWRIGIIEIEHSIDRRLIHDEPIGLRTAFLRLLLFAISKTCCKSRRSGKTAFVRRHSFIFLARAGRTPSAFLARLIRQRAPERLASVV